MNINTDFKVTSSDGTVVTTWTKGFVSFEVVCDSGESFSVYHPESLALQHTSKHKCSHCGQWGLPYSVCEHCGAPIDD